MTPTQSTTPPLRLIHVVSSLKVGGMEHFVIRLALAQKEAGHAPLVLALQDGPLRDAAEQHNLPFRVLRGNKIARTAQAAAIFARTRPRIIHAHNDSSLHYAALGKQLTGAKLVITNHGQGSGVFRTPTGREIALTDAAVGVSQAVANKMDTARLGEKICTIYNGVTFARPDKSRADVRAALGLADDRVIGVMVARIDALKGHDTLLQALALLKAQGTTTTLLLAGDGAERAARQTQARDLGLTDKEVRFLGFRGDVPDLLGAADFFALPSLTEGLPLSILEAMSHRLTTVATTVGGIPELIHDGTHGFLFSVGDAPALARAVATLAHNPQEREAMGQAAYARVTQHFSFARMLGEYDALYQHVLVSPRPAPTLSTPSVERV